MARLPASITSAIAASLMAGRAVAQDPVWSPDVATIIYEHCSSCHHEGSIGPFPLMSYADAVDQAWVIGEHVENRHMPPWPADPEYRHFKDENVLTQGEIDAVVDWVLLGTPYGDPGAEPDPPVFPPGGSLLDMIDFTVAIEPYQLQYNTDEYRWFVITNPFPTTIHVNAIEVFPGLDSVVHHADISYDNTGASLANDLTDPLPGFNGSTGPPTYSFYMNAWQPGGNVVRYPPQWGIAVPPGADFVVEIHYGPGAQGLIDSTRMNLEFVTGSGIRPVSVGWLLGHDDMIDGPLAIPANTVQTFHQEYTLPSSRSFVSICPHMHHVGVAYTVWYEYGGDSIPLIDIPQWDFHWQRYYTFQMVQPIPAGAVIKSIGVYDNTVNNPDNPHIPPQNMYAGSTTDSEMFLTYFIWANYQSGDEGIVLDSTIIAGIGSSPTDIDWSVFPNPTQGDIWVGLGDEVGPIARLRVLDLLGAVLKEQPMMVGGMQGPQRIDLGHLGPGLYQVELLTPNGRSVRKVLRW